MTDLDDRPVPLDVEAGSLDDVPPRLLVATQRERELDLDGVDESADRRYLIRDDGDTLKMTLRSFMGDFARSLDPRGVAGSRRALAIFGLLALVGYWDDIALGVVLPDLQADFAFDLSFLLTIGLLVPTIGDAISPLLGYYADRAKRVNLVRIGNLLSNLSSMSLTIVHGLGGFMLSRLALTVGVALPAPATLSLQADYFPPRSRIRALSFIAAAGLVGAVVGPVIAGLLDEAYGWRTCFFVLGGVATCASLATFLLREPLRGYHERMAAGATEEVALHETEPPSFGEAFRIARSSGTVRRFWVAGLFGYPALFDPVGIVLILIGVFYAADFGVEPTARGVLFAVAGLVAMLALPYSGTITDRLLAMNPGRVMLLLGISAWLRAGCYVAMALSPSFWLSVIIFLPTVFMGAVIRPAVQGIYTLVMPPSVRAFGTQTGKPFEILGRFLLPAWLGLGALIAGPWTSQAGHALVGIAIPSIAAGFVLASAASAVGRDIRSGIASSMADEESRRAKEQGRAKLLVCRDVEVTYAGTQVLFGVDFHVDDGELVALLGTNGAGKSTLLRAICGLQHASNGAIFVDGKDVTNEPLHRNARRGIVFVPGGHAVFPTLTVAENLQMGAWLSDDDELDARRAKVLELFPVLATRKHALAGSLSGGEQQMLAIGQALLMKPRLLMIDELSLGLAPAVVEELLVALRQIHAEGVTIIIVEQSVNVATTIADRAVYMEKGQIRYDGPTAELLAQPELVRAVFMGGAITGSRRREPAAIATVRSLTEPILRVTDVALSYGGVRALDGVSFELAPGEVVGIIGPNGAGKTTLFDVISGFTRAEHGTVEIDGTDVTALTPDGRALLGLGRSFQAARLFPALTVRDNIAVAMEQRFTAKSPLLTATWAPKVRAEERRAAKRVQGLVEMLGLQAYADKFVDELSTGTRRAVDIACIMAAQPKVLLLDEPSSGLAQAETEELGPVLDRLARETGCAMLVIEHDIGLVSSISHRLIAMELGTVIATGHPAAVLSDRRVLVSYLSATEDVVARSDLARAVLGDSATHRTGALS